MNRPLLRFAPRLLALVGLAVGAAIAPGLPAAALDDVHAGPVAVEEYRCDPTSPPTPKNPCPKPVDCSDQPLGQPCRRVCVDPNGFGLCVWHTPGGYRADLDGACVGYLGEHTQACLNGFDGCAVTLTGVRLQCE